MDDVFVLPEEDIGIKDCSDIQPWDRKSLRYDYILKATTGDSDYPIDPEEVGICTSLWVHGNAQIDNIQINQTITGNPTSYLGDVTAANINSLDIDANGTVTADYFVGDGGGLYNVGGYMLDGINTTGISTFTDLLVTRDLTVNRNANIAGIVTASSFVSSGTTAVYVGIGTTTVDSNTTAFHYVTFDTTNTRVNISNFTSGKKFEIVARNSSAGSRDLIVGTSNTSAVFTTVPRIVHAAGTITTGTISINATSGLLISIFNMGGTIIASY
jgi:hypothetical protein